ncbi:hypothetical protein ACTFIU_002682 [Dictyostelium citrinum]
MIKLQEMLPNGNNNNSSSNSNNCRDNNSSSNTITTTDISTTEQHSKNNNSKINNSNNIVKTTLPTHIALHKYNELHRTLGMNPSQASSREPLFLSQPTVGSLYKVVSQITTNSDQTKPDVHSFLKKSSLHNDIKLCLKPVYLCEEGRKP